MKIIVDNFHHHQLWWHLNVKANNFQVSALQRGMDWAGKESEEVSTLLEKGLAQGEAQMITITDPILSARYSHDGAILVLDTPTGIQELAILPAMLTLPDEPALAFERHNLEQPNATMTDSSGEDFIL